MVHGGVEKQRRKWRKMFGKGKKLSPWWRRRAEKEKEEKIWRRKFNGEANQPTS